jgi:3',5'-cyclic AMP phosphodiesterase CpdA
VAVRILHVSDLHVGKGNDAAVERGLAELVERLAPTLILATGDLTHRGRRDQHQQAAAQLRALGPPVVAIPGNHDIPYTFPARFTHPWREFERLWEQTEPVYGADGVLVVGLNSVRPWRHQSGGLRDARLRWAAERFAQAPAGALRVAAMHHQMIGAPWRSRKRPMARRNHVLASLLEAGAELILSGHTHQGAIAERHEFEAWSDGNPGVAISTAPGLGQPRPHRLGEARGLVVYDAEETELRAQTYVWRGAEWRLTGVRRFPRGTGVLPE